MQIGNYTDGGESISFEWEGDDPVLIVGREATETLRRLFLDALYNDEKCTFIGNAEEVLPYIPKNKVTKTALFELDYEFPRSCNPFKGVSTREKSGVAQYMVDDFHAAYPTDYETHQFDMYLRAGALAMMEIRDGTLLSLAHLFMSKEYRERVIGHLKDSTSLKKVWEHFHSLSDREQNDRSLSLLNRLIPLITDPLYANTIGQTKGLSLKDTDILLVSLPEGTQAQLIAGLLLSRIKGKVFIEKPYIHVGSSQPVIACRYLDQLPKKLREQLISTAVLISFRLGVKDEKVLAPHFELPNQDANLLRQLLPYKALIRLEDTHELYMPYHSYPKFPKSAQKIKDRSRSQFGKKREQVEERIARFVENT